MDGRVLVINGCATSLGKALSVHLATSGFKLALTCGVNDRDAGILLCNEIKAISNGEVVFACIDSSQESVSRLMRQFKKTFNRLDGLINCQTTLPEFVKPPHLDFASFAEMHEINFVSMLNFSNEFVRLILNPLTLDEPIPDAGYSVISFGAASNSLHGAAFESSIRAVVSLTKSLAKEHGHLACRFNVISPGFIVSSGLHGLLESTNFTMDSLEEKVPLARLGRNEDVMGVVDFLLSPAAGYISGIELVVDGGLSC